MLRRSIPLLILSAMPAAVLWRVLFAGESLSGGDLVNQYIPYKTLIAQEIRAGEFPHWNAMTFSGRPLQADIQVGVFYPPNLLFLWMRADNAFDWLAWLHLAWMGLGCHLFLRRLTGDAAGALLGASVFSFSGFFATQLLSGIVLFIFTGSWLPWMLWAVDRGRGGGRPGAWLALAGFGALQLLAGAPQIVFFSWILAGAYLLVGLILSRGDEAEFESPAGSGAPSGIARSRLMAISGFVAAVALMAGITAVQWMPTREFLSLSFDRGSGASWEFITDGSLRFGWVVTYLLPFLFQHPGNEALYWGSGSGSTPVGYWEFNAYCGVLAPALAAAGLGALRRRAPAREQRAAVFAVLCVALWVALAPGARSPLFRIAYDFIPGFDRFRVPARWVLAYQLGLAILVALGWKRAASAWHVKSRTMLCSSLLLFVVGGFALIALRPIILNAMLEAGGQGHLLNAPEESPLGSVLESHRSAFFGASLRLGASALLLSLVFLARRGQNWGPRMAAFALLAVLLDGGQFASALVLSDPTAKFGEEFYSYSEARQEIAACLKDGGRWAWDDTVFDWHVDQNQLELYANRAILYGLPTSRGYDPVNSRRYGEFSNAAAGIPLDMAPRAFMFLPQPANRQMQSLLNVRCMVSYQPLEPFGWKLRKAFPFGLRVYENPDAVGDAFLAKAELANHRSNDDSVALFSELLAPDFKWRNACFPEIMFYKIAPPARPDLTPATTVLGKGSNWIYLHAKVAEMCVLVITQSWYPGWRVEVDGKTDIVTPVNRALTGVWLDPGEHDIRFTYRPTAFAHGESISLISLALFVISAIALMLCHTAGRAKQTGALAET